MAETLAELFVRKRESQGLTLSEVAQAARIGRVSLWDIESGKNANPTIKTLAKLQDFYGVSSRELWAAARNSL